VTAVDDDRPIARHVFEPCPEAAEGNMDCVVEMAGSELIRLADVEGGGTRPERRSRTCPIDEFGARGWHPGTGPGPRPAVEPAREAFKADQSRLFDDAIERLVASNEQQWRL
jgi:hypothetical protein